MFKLKFLDIYNTDSIEIQKKARVLFFIIISVIAIFIPNLINDVVTGDYIPVIIEVFIIVIFCTSLILLLKGKFRAVSVLLLFIIVVAMNLLVVLKKFETPEEVFKAGLYNTLPIFLCAIIGITLWQPVASTFIGSVSILLIFFFRILPHKEMITSGDVSGYWLIPLSVIVMTGLFTYLTLFIEKEIIKKAEDETTINTRRVSEMTMLFESSKNGLEVSELLTSLSNDTVNDLNSITSRIDTIQAGIGDFMTQVKTTGEANSQILESKTVVETEITNQSLAMTESLNVIKRITESINNISEEASGKKGVVEELIVSGKEGKDHLENTVESIEKVSDSSSNVLEIITVIEGIASRTNLLAMNAAIEAAHAGEFGKGFSVVAEEIKKLSEETNENSHLIKQTLENNITDIRSATESNTNTSEKFTDMIAKISIVSNALNEIILAMSVLMSGTSEINKSVSYLDQMHKNVINSINSMEATIAISEQATIAIEKSSGQLKVDLNDIFEKTRNILGAIAQLDEIGRKNKVNIESLSSGIGKIKEA